MKRWHEMTPDEKERAMRLIDYLYSPQFILDTYDPDDATPEETDEYLRACGYDPDELVKSMRARINTLIAKYQTKD